MEHFTPGEIMLSLVIGTMTVVMLKVGASVAETRDMLQKFMLSFERRLTRAEERVRHHAHILGNRGGGGGLPPHDDADDDTA